MDSFFTTRRLVARRFRLEDCAAFAAMRADPETARFQDWEAFGHGEALAFVTAQSGAEPGGPGWFQFALVERESGAFAGDCALRIDAANPRLAAIGYSIVTPLRGQGLASEAVGGLVRFAFGRFGVHRITASVDPRNLASMRVLERSGFVKEAHFRKAVWFKGAWADDAVYALLASDPHDPPADA